MRLSAAIFAAWLVCVASSQDRPQGQQPPIFRAGVDVVQLEVSILDKARRPVHGLTKHDLQVFEDRRLQDVVDVQEILLDVEPTPPAWARAVPLDIATNDIVDRRLLAIVMDDLHCCALPASAAAQDLLSSDHWAIDNAVAAANRLIDGLGPHDLATVALTHDQIATQRFTSDRAALRAMVARFAPVTEVGCRPPQPARSPEPDLLRLLEMSPHPMKAMVVLMSPVAIDSRKLPRCPSRSSTVPASNSAPRLDPLGLPTVPVYKLNVSGLLVDRALSRRNGPNATGGLNFYSTNDLKPAVEALLEENNAYYLIEFRTSRPTTDGKYRQLDIKVTRPGEYIVRTRAGYLRPALPPKPGSRADQRVERARPPVSVAGLLPDADVEISATAAAFAMPGSRNALLVTTVDLAHPIAESLASSVEELNLRTVAYASTGEAKYDVYATTAVDVPAGAVRVSTSFPSRLPVEPDRYELWLTAHDARTNRLGGVFYNIDVPDFTSRAVALSGVVLGRRPSIGAALSPALVGLVPIVPTASRTFNHGDVIAAFFQVYQGRDTTLVPVELSVRVLDNQGATKIDVRESLAADRFGTNRAADYLLALPLDRLTTGQHLLTIEARVPDRISPTRDVPFRVR